MKKYHKYIALAALTLSFAACTQDEDFVPQGDSDAVKINATIGAMQTRVAYGENGETTFEPNDQIRVINDTRAGKSKSEAIYQTDGNGSWSPVDNTKYLVWDGSSANTFYGVYPTTANYTQFTLPADQSEDLALADWMTDDYVGAKSEGAVSLDLQHRLAKVTVRILKWTVEFDNRVQEVTDPIIYSKGTDLTATYGEDGVTITSTGDDIEITPLVDEIYPSYTAIVAPVKYNTNDTFMTLTVKGQEMTVKANDNETLTEGLQAGYHYTFNLTVGKEGARVYYVSVTPWTGKDIDGGVAEEVTTE